MNVFISYSTKDKDRVDLFKQLLNNAGYNTWMAPGSIPGSSSYIREIPAAIRSSDVVVLFLSKKSQESFWVTAEIENAIIKNKQVFPFEIDQLDELSPEFQILIGRSQITFAYELSDNDAISALDKSIGNWFNNMSPNATHNFPTVKYEKIQYEEDDYYEGETVNGVPHGMGIRHYVDDSVYEGLWEKGVRKGRGKYTYITDDVYEGEWLNDEKSGYGKYYFANGDFYCGYWKKDQKNGKGKLVTKKGDVYSGEWKDDKRHGEGTYTFSNGSVCSGSWKDGKPIGRVRFIDPKGKVTDGNFPEGILDSKGRFYNEDFDYRGDFVNGKPHGKGILIFENGEKYEGDFVDGIITGKGKWTYLNGNYYEGEFVDFERVGKGTFYRIKNGSIITGTWKNDKIFNGYLINKKGRKRAAYILGKRIL